MSWEIWFNMNDQEIELINSQTRNQKIKDFYQNNKKKIFLTFIFLFILVLLLFGVRELKENKKIKISEEYKSTILNYNQNDKQTTINRLKDIIFEKDKTYSPLALYFIIDNNLIEAVDDINILFDIIINEVGLDKDVKNLNIYKKALLNSNKNDETRLLTIIDPIIKNKNPWQSHSFFLLGEFYYYNGNKIKSKEYFEKILTLENVIDSIKLETRKRLQRDFSD